MKSSRQERESLKAAYGRRHIVLEALARNLDAYIRELVGQEARIDRVAVRPKGIDRFLQKAAASVDGKQKYAEPLSEIQDQIGARIVVFYETDVDRLDKHVKKYFTAIEYQKVVPDSESEFGYFGHHLVLVLPEDIIEDGMDRDLIPGFFELQIKTLFQHAWSEANHDLGYKPGGKELSSEQKRLCAFTSAQAWGADHIFNQLFRELVVK